MGIIDRLAGRLGYSKRQPPAMVSRSFKAADTDRLNFSFTTTNSSINADLYAGLDAMRARSRDLWANNEYMRRFVGLVKTNVVGPRGVTFQSRAKRPDGRLDQPDNDAIESHYRRWRQKGSLDVTGRLSGIDAERLFIETVARDGEALIRIARGAGGSYRLQFIDVDRLPTDYNEESHPDTGNRVIMGIEVDRNDAAVAYHVLRKHPGGSQFERQEPQERIRIPAEDVIHAFIVHRPGQVRGIPWAHAAILGMKDLGGYREAAIIAARVGASKVAYWRTGDSDGGPHDDYAGDGTPIVDAEPGTFGKIGPDTDLVEWDPNYPHDQFGAFNTAMLHGLSAGFGVAHHSLSGDLTGVNFSTARVALLDERDAWMAFQQWMIESLHERIFPDWLEWKLKAGAIVGANGSPLPYSQFAKFNEPRFQARRWAWVDPLRDEQANALAYALRTKSLTQIIEERGQDPEDVWTQIERDSARLAEAGIDPTLPSGVFIPETENQDAEK